MELSFEFSADTVPTILVLAGVLFILLAFVAPGLGGLLWWGVGLLVVGITLFVLAGLFVGGT